MGLANPVHIQQDWAGPSDRHQGSGTLEHNSPLPLPEEAVTSYTGDWGWCQA